MGSKPQAPSFDFNKRFQHLADSDMNSDCEFVVGPQKTLIKGHKVIFCLASEVFQAMFFGNLREERSIQVEDLDPDGFRGMKTFIYTGEVSFTSAFHALDTYIAARKYIIPDLSIKCVKCINNQIKPFEVLEFLDRCKTNVIDIFDGLCIKIIQEKTVEVLASKYFISASIQTIELILKSHSLKLNSEIELYGHFERWALAEVQRQKIPADRVSTRFNDLKKHIRFLTISSDDFVLKVAPSTLLTQEEKLAIALNKMRFDSKMTSNTIISMTLQSRNFNKMLSIPTINKEFNTKIVLDIEQRKDRQIILSFTEANMKPSVNQSCDEVRVITVHWSVHDEYICCEAQPNTNFIGENKLMIIRTEMKVLASDGCGYKTFENESKYIHKNKVFQNSVVLAVIPKSIPYIEKDGKTCIQSRFKIELFNL